MGKVKSPGAQRLVRHRRVRQKVAGTHQRPRLCVFRSVRHTYAQVIDDSRGHTLASASSLELPQDGARDSGGKTAAARQVGLLVAQRSLSQGLKEIVFDRGGYLYHGRVKALADAAREGGLSF